MLDMQQRFIRNIPCPAGRISGLAAVVRRRQGEGEEDVGPAGSPILIHSITADNDRVNGPLTLDELRGAPAPLRSLLRSPASPSNLIHAAEEGGWERGRGIRTPHQIHNASGGWAR